MLAASDQGLVRVVVSDGFLTASDQSDGPFTVGNNPPFVYLAAPRVDPIFVDGQVIRFEATALDPEEGQLTDNSLQWTSSIDGPFGEGEAFTLLADDLSAGSHVVTVTAMDGNGSSADAFTNIWVGIGDTIFDNSFEQ